MFSQTEAKTRPKNGIVHKLVNREIHGTFKNNSCLTNNLFDKLPKRLAFRLCDLVEESMLQTGHIFLGFTKDELFVLSYTFHLETMDHSLLYQYHYKLHWWRFVPYKKLEKVSEVKLFGEHEIERILKIYVCQWPTDDSKLLIYGCSTSTFESTECFLTITANPSYKVCEDCSLLKNTSELDEEDRSNIYEHQLACFKHQFVVHAQFYTVPPFPPFSPLNCMTVDGYVLLNTGDSIISLSISLENEKPGSYVQFPPPSPSWTDDLSFSPLYISSPALSSPVLSPDSFAQDSCSTDSGLKSPTLRTHRTLSEELVVNSTFNHCPSNSASLLSLTYIDEHSSSPLSPKQPKETPSHKAFSSDNCGSSKSSSLSGNHHHHHIANSKINNKDDLEGAPTLGENLNNNPKKRKNAKADDIYDYFSLLSPTESKRKTPTSKSDIYSGDFTEDFGSPPKVMKRHEAVKENISPMVRKYSNKNEGLGNVTNRTEVIESVEKKCVTEGTQYFLNGFPGIERPADEGEEDCSALEYHQLFALDVKGTGNTRARPIPASEVSFSKESLLKIHQKRLDIEKYVHEVAQQMCEDTCRKFLSFSDYDVGIIDLCPLSQTALFTVFILIQACPKSTPKFMRYTDRKTYGTGFKFTWNIKSGVYSIIEKEEMKEYQALAEDYGDHGHWCPAQLAVKKIAKDWPLPRTPAKSVNVLTNASIFKGQSLKVLWSPFRSLALIL